jgi:hypothetical protein
MAFETDFFERKKSIQDREILVGSFGKKLTARDLRF